MRIRRHKARQNMRLTKIAQPPAHQRNNRHEVQALEHINVLDALLLNHFQESPKPPTEITTITGVRIRANIIRLAH